MNNKEYLFYMHTGSGNHGCEAIVRTTSKLLNQSVTVFTKNVSEDEHYIQDNNLHFIETGNTPPVYTLDGLYSRILIKGFHKPFAFVKPSYKSLVKSAGCNTVAFSIGGDNYCYDGMPEVLAILNKELNGRGAKTVLFGCSIEPDLLEEERIRDDLQRYSLIVARESITYNALKSAGIHTNILLAADPAFTLETKVNDDVTDYIHPNTVGINLSPLVLEGGNTLLFDSYCKMIEWIINETDMNIALIPHVVWKGNDDRIPLQKLYDLYKSTERLSQISDHNAVEQKGYISRCRFFVGARTHATIAAYSSYVPTLVAGYSVKSQGIAKDLFGEEGNYVVPTKDLKDENTLLKSFKWVIEHEETIAETLKRRVPEYTQLCYSAAEAARKL